MSKAAIGWLIAAIVVIGGITIYAMSGSDQVKSDEITGKTETQTTASGRSIKELIADGKPQMCTFSNSSDTSESSGTIYIANGLVRGDFTTTVKGSGGSTVVSHMLVNNGFNYVWTSDSDQGFKIALSESEQTPQAVGQGGQYQAVNYDEKLNYKCQDWALEGSRFAMPVGITFLDMDKALEGMPKIPAPPADR